jgi:DNA-binding transcriptional ArsR family regulator
MNMIKHDASTLTKVSDLLQVISPQPRLEILLAIGAGEACVCHLEAVLGQRQAYISQQMMALREAGLLDSRRDGKYNFYRLVKPEILVLLQKAAQIVGGVANPEQTGRKKQCTCPHCAPANSNSILIEQTH